MGRRFLEGFSSIEPWLTFAMGLGLVVVGVGMLLMPEQRAIPGRWWASPATIIVGGAVIVLLNLARLTLAGSAQLIVAAIILAIAIAGVIVIVRGQDAGVGAGWTPPATGVTPELDEGTEREVALLVAQGKKIAAIKRVREVTGIGLAEAKHIVDTLQTSSRLPEQ